MINDANLFVLFDLNPLNSKSLFMFLKLLMYHKRDTAYALVFGKCVKISQLVDQLNTYIFFLDKKMKTSSRTTTMPMREKMTATAATHPAVPSFFVTGLVF